MEELWGSIGINRLMAKNAMLIRRGECLGSLFFVKTGLVKAYYETYEGKQFVKSFIKEGGYIASMQAVVAGSPSTFSAECIEPCTVLEVPRSELHVRLATDPIYVEAVNIMLLELAAKKEQREYEFLCLSAEERYASLLENEPELVKRLSQKDVARYIGIDPVSLCRIQKRRRRD